MIFVVFGNVPLPFTRLARVIDEIAPELGEEVFVQSGYTSYTFRNVASVSFLDANDMKQKIKQASIVITHGGWGTISECLEMNKRIVAVPRQIGIEHHHSQYDIVQALEAMGCLQGVYDEEKLLEAIQQARHFKHISIKRGEAGESINSFLLSVKPFHSLKNEFI